MKVSYLVFCPSVQGTISPKVWAGVIWSSLLTIIIFSYWQDNYAKLNRDILIFGNVRLTAMRVEPLWKSKTGSKYRGTRTN